MYCTPRWILILWWIVTGKVRKCSSCNYCFVLYYFEIKSGLCRELRKKIGTKSSWKTAETVCVNISKLSEMQKKYRQCQQKRCEYLYARFVIGKNEDFFRNDKLKIS